jgi:sugar/nucleoside kinase (ribokinase family)
MIFTLGVKDIMYGRKGQQAKHFKPYTIEVVSTLGAGDSFRAGCVYALLQNMNDNETISFSAATAACACSVFPLPLNPPALEKVKALQQQG